MHVQANDIKTKGIKAMTDAFDEGVCIVSNRGKPVLAAIDIEKYNRFREWELDEALAESNRDIENGDYTDNVKEHLKAVLGE